MSVSVQQEDFDVGAELAARAAGGEFVAGFISDAACIHHHELRHRCG